MKTNTLINKTLRAAAVTVAAIICVISMLTALPGGALAAANQMAPIYSADDLFTDRDLEQEPDLSEAESITLTDGQDVTLTSAGVYVLSGTAKNATVYVDAGDDDKVQLVLDGVNVTNDSMPAIYVKNADKVFITMQADSSLSVTGSFQADGSANLDGVIFAKDDITINGTAALAISSTDNGVVCKNDLRITGGTLNITAAAKGLEAKESIRICGGVININAGSDGIQAKDSDDNTVGYIAVFDGEITIVADDDGIHAVTVLQIDGGNVSVTAEEGLEATVVQINGGTVNIAASDDGVNAASKSSVYAPAVIFNGGYTTIVMGQGDTDGVDSNGDIYVNGGTVEVTGQSTFDCDGVSQKTGGTIIVNGSETDTIPNQMMGGFGGMGGWGGQQGNQQGGWGGQQGNQQGGWGGQPGGRPQGGMGGRH
ncbi:MAG: carbohydrate-binding domain-containing protein [Clostridia bacterium]|nr:carbohydrate-binding domain-containing protein [Clostridia bacterium]